MNSLKHFRSIHTVLFMLLLIAGPVLGDSWKVYNESSGLPANQVLSFAAAKDRMVVGTSRGIALFHGDDCAWRTIPLPAGFEDAQIRDLAFDANGNLWAASQKGLIFVNASKVEVFSTGDGLPNNDIERVQIRDNHLFVGCFGGLITRGVIPTNGRTSFVPVNFDRATAGDKDKLRSVGVSGLGMKSLNQGWIATKGGGLLEIRGSDVVAFDATQGLPSDWVEAMWIFSDRPSSEKLLAVTSMGLCLLENGTLMEKNVFPREDTWLTSVVSLKKKPDEDKARFAASTTAALTKFMGDRSLWVGTRDQGLWRFEDAKWTQFTPENSILPTIGVNRLFRVGGRLVVCTNAGLVIVSLGGQGYDEYKRTGFGSRHFKTFFPYPKVTEIRKIVLGKDLWVSHGGGLSRFAKSTGMFRDMMEVDQDVSGSLETPTEKEGDADPAPKTAPVARGGEKLWYVFEKENGTIPSGNVYDMALDDSGYLWVIFDKKHLCRLRMVVYPTKPGSDEKIERPHWEFFGEMSNLGPLGDRKKGTKALSDEDKASWAIIEKYYAKPAEAVYKSGAEAGFDQPWPDDTKLSCVWYDRHQQRLLVGTAKSGIYALNNPGSNVDEARKDPFQWTHIGDLESMPPIEVVGFDYFTPFGESKQLAVLGLNELLLFDGKVFREIPLGGRRENYCIQADGLGNLLIGSDGGLFKLRPDLGFLSYTKTNAGFQSHRVIALAVAAMPGGAAEYWVGTREPVCFDKFYYLKQDPRRRGAGAGSGTGTEAGTPPLGDTNEVPGGSLLTPRIGVGGSSGEALQVAPNEGSQGSSGAGGSSAGGSGQGGAGQGGATPPAGSGRLLTLGPGQYIDDPMYPRETDIDGGSLNSFDGIDWDCWKVPGITCLLVDGDFLWVGTNNRIRRFYIKVF